MSIRIAIQHQIEQRFDRPVRLSTHWLRLRPAPQMRANVTAYSLAVHNDPHFLNWVRDPFENHLARLNSLRSVQPGHQCEHSPRQRSPDKFAALRVVPQPVMMLS